MNEKPDITEKIVFENDLPPVEEPDTMTQASNDVEYIKEDDLKLKSDKAYQKAGHGTVLLQEEGSRNQALESHDYYKQGYSGQKKEELGKEKSKAYDKEREVDMLDRQVAPEYVQSKTQAPEIGPRKQKVVEAEKPKGQKTVENVGSKKYPERLAKQEGNKL